MAVQPSNLLRSERTSWRITGAGGELGRFGRRKGAGVRRCRWQRIVFEVLPHQDFIFKYLPVDPVVGEILDVFILRGPKQRETAGAMLHHAEHEELARAGARFATDV